MCKCEVMMNFCELLEETGSSLMKVHVSQRGDCLFNPMRPVEQQLRQSTIRWISPCEDKMFSFDIQDDIKSCKKLEQPNLSSLMVIH